MKNLFNRFVREESGQDIIEYVLLAAFISVVAWTIIQTIGADVTICTTDTQAVTGAAAALPPKHPRVTGGGPPAVRLSGLS